MKLTLTILANIIITTLVIVVLTQFAENAHPTSGLYNLKRVEEKLILATKNTPEQKVDYYVVMLNNRQEEIKMVMASRDYRHLLDTSLRYTSQAGDITNIITLTNDKNAATKLQKQFTKDRELFEKYMDNLPPNTPEQIYLQDGLNYITIYENQLPR